jgi:hypothetical protein
MDVIMEAGIDPNGKELSDKPHHIPTIALAVDHRQLALAVELMSLQFPSQLSAKTSCLSWNSLVKKEVQQR